jgi:hypothetical protein
LAFEPVGNQELLRYQLLPGAPQLK